MTALAAPAGTNSRVPTAAVLAARIQIPRRLPSRYDGQPLRHLSHSSYSKFLLCPDDWRRHYLLGERTPPSGHMFLGARVDHALSTYHRHLLACGERLTLDQLHDAYRDHWTRELAAEQAERGVHWDAELDETGAFTMGLQALALSLRELIPLLGRPGDVQRRLARRPRPHPAARPAARRPAGTRVPARARPGMDDPGLPRPRTAAARRGRPS